MTSDDFKEILAAHTAWLRREPEGKRANLSRANLSRANLSPANLSDADLRYADLRYADLSDADLRYADLSRANLSRANLSRANLSRANLSCANLSDADLSRANLSDADLRYADLSGAENIPDTARLLTQIVPEVGAFEGFKKAGGCMVHLRIPADAERCNATGRKCRASAAEVLAIYDLKGGRHKRAESDRGGVYIVGKVTKPDSWDPDRWNECSHGIHFFLTRAEAEAYI